MMTAPAERILNEFEGSRKVTLRPEYTSRLSCFSFLSTFLAIMQEEEPVFLLLVLLLLLKIPVYRRRRLGRQREKKRMLSLGERIPTA